MIVNKFPVERMTLEKFADEYGLVMEVRERGVNFPHNERWYASFATVEVEDGSLLCGVFGNGATPEEAIRDYGRQISGKTLAVGPRASKITVYVPLIVDGDGNGR